MVMRPLLAASALALFGALGACQDGGFSGVPAKALSPIPPQTMQLMAEKGMSRSDPILIRAYKKEAEMEVWKRKADGRYALLKTFPICRWSGQLGPKVKQGDRQAPEGFYPVGPGQMNPNSSYYLSFDTGFPNNFDRANGRTGTYLMVHGTCSSAGCFAMTDESISEIYAIARDAFGSGQKAFQFQSYPFRMTAQNLAKFRHDPNMPFWKNLKEGADYFEVTKEEPRVGVCGKRYVFGGADAAAGACNPRVEPEVAERREKDEVEVAALVAKGTPAVRLVYDDGGQHAVFRDASARIGDEDPGSTLILASRPRRNLGDVSRPDALAAGPREVPVDAGGRPVLVAEAGTDVKEAVTAKSGTTPPRPTALAFAQPGKTSPAPIPSREAAKASAGRGGESTVAKAEPTAKPAAITVADAGDDPSVYQSVLGNLFGKTAKPPSEAKVAAAEPVAPPEPAPKAKLAGKSQVVAPAQKPTGVNPTATAKPAPKVEAKPGPQAGAEPRPMARHATAQGLRPSE